MSESEKLLPCPFCGANFKMGQEPHDNYPVEGMFYLYHEYGSIGSEARNCVIDVPRHFHSAAEAATAWNTRKGAAREAGWRPIETAPKDGTVVLVYEGDNYFAAQWVPIDEHWASYCGQPVVWPPQPTHWMPLPLPPQEKGGE